MFRTAKKSWNSWEPAENVDAKEHIEEYEALRRSWTQRMAQNSKFYPAWKPAKKLYCCHALIFFVSRNESISMAPGPSGRERQKDNVGLDYLRLLRVKLGLSTFQNQTLKCSFWKA